MLLYFEVLRVVIISIPPGESRIWAANTSRIRGSSTGAE